MSSGHAKDSKSWDATIVASNRGPVEYVRRQSGKLEAHRGSGGLVTALSAIADAPALTWVAAPITEADRQVADGAEAPAPPIAQRFVPVDPRIYRRYYDRVSNSLLWFLQHYMLDSAREPHIDQQTYRSWEDGYVPTNEAFARTIFDAAQAASRPLVLVHDYHLYLVPSLVRAARPDALIEHFTHIPWPEPRYWQLIPDAMRQAICHGLLGANLLGFQTGRDVANFLDCCEGLVPEATVDRAVQEVRRDGRTTVVRPYPISIDPERLRRLARSAEVRRFRDKLRPLTGEQTIVRVDRLEPSKNILRGFDALDALFERRPDLVGRVRMLAFLVPSRESLPMYRQYRQDVFARVEEINGRYGRDGNGPVVIFHENNYPQAVAAMTLYDVLLVNPVIDGMNLVAKEGPIVNQRDGVLILSEGAGAHDQLGAWALSVAPADVLGTSQALEHALEMTPAERRVRGAAIRPSIEREDVHWWLSRQLDDLAHLASARRSSPKSRQAP